MFRSRYGNVFEGPEEWRKIETTEGMTFQWHAGSTYVAHPPFFENMPKDPEAVKDVHGARPLAILADRITTDHISPAGSIKKDGPAGSYLMEFQVRPADFNSYGARRGNHEVMMRGTFANVRIRNEMVPGIEGGMSKHLPDGKVGAIYDVAMQYQKEGVPLVIIAGKEYGTGSSRDWAAKGTLLLGVRAVLAESYERIHRSNLVGMGVLPLQFLPGESAASLGLTGRETYEVEGIAGGLAPGKRLTVQARGEGGKVRTFQVIVRVDTPDDVEYYRHGGLLPYVLRGMVATA